LGSYFDPRGLDRQAYQDLLALRKGADPDILMVLYEMAARRRVFQGRSSFDLSSAILNEAPAALPKRHEISRPARP
jgi:hypothetical protein